MALEPRRRGAPAPEGGRAAGDSDASSGYGDESDSGSLRLAGRGKPGAFAEFRDDLDDGDSDRLRYGAMRRPVTGVAREMEDGAARDAAALVEARLHEVGGRRTAGSAPDLGRRRISEQSLAGRRSEASEGAARRSDAPSEEADDPGAERDMVESAGRYVSYSWRETLAHIPGLLERYPLAASSEHPTAVEEHPGGEEPPQERGPVYIQWEGNESEEYLNCAPVNRPSRSPSLAQQEDSLADQGEATPLPGEAGQLAPAPDQPAAFAISTPQQLEPGSTPQSRAHKAVPGMASSRKVAGPAVHNVIDAYMAGAPPTPPTQSADSWYASTPRSAPGGRSNNWRSHSASGPRHRSNAERHSLDKAWDVDRAMRWQQVSRWGNDSHHGRPASSLADAWAEVEEARQRLDERDRELCQRESAARRAELRNRTTARQLAELRRRLDDYGQELEEGVVALTTQQHALREERRQIAELRASARRSCAITASDGAAARLQSRDKV